MSGPTPPTYGHGTDPGTTGAVTATGGVDMSVASSYLFEARDDPGRVERDRLTALTGLFDPATRRFLEGVGVGPGWRCLEVAAGTGTIAGWLADRVGAGGEIFATDVDVQYLRSLPPQVTYARHDILSDPLPWGTFDLVHARLLLEHLDDRDLALRRMAAAVRPGGVVVVEDAEMSAEAVALSAKYLNLPSRDLGRRALDAIAGLLGGAGADMGYASRLPDSMRQAGLEVVGGEVHSPLVRGGPQDFGALTMAALRRPAVGAGLLTEADVDAFLAMTADPGSQYVPFLMTSVWGRRPD